MELSEWLIYLSYQSLIELISDNLIKEIESQLHEYQSLIELISDTGWLWVYPCVPEYQSLIELISDAPKGLWALSIRLYQSLIELISDKMISWHQNPASLVSISYRVNFWLIADFGKLIDDCVSISYRVNFWRGNKQLHRIIFQSINLL